MVIFSRYRDHGRSAISTPWLKAAYKKMGFSNLSWTWMHVIYVERIVISSIDLIMISPGRYRAPKTVDLQAHNVSRCDLLWAGDQLCLIYFSLDIFTKSALLEM